MTSDGPISWHLEITWNLLIPGDEHLDVLVHGGLTLRCEHGTSTNIHVNYMYSSVEVVERNSTSRVLQLIVQVL